jgi:D-sedoheptulose 7-phosphate isomerase
MSSGISSPGAADPRREAGAPAMGGADRVHAVIGEAIAVHEALRQADPRPLLDAVMAIVEALGRGGKLLAFGNGGSAADAQHVAAELVGRFQHERRALAALALTTDTSVLTSVANDTGFDRVFARQVEAIGRPEDVVLAISTSGRSVSVVAGLEAARARGLRTIALTGRDAGAVGRAADIQVTVPSASTPRVQEAHRTILHLVCELVERALPA